jgi:hypothetical protein
MDQTEGIKSTGRFNTSPEKQISGDLTLAGAKTSLYVHDKDKFDLQNIPDQCIKGQLHDLTKVTLIDCVTAPEPGYARRNEESYYFANVFPHCQGRTKTTSVGRSKNASVIHGFRE